MITCGTQVVSGGNGGGGGGASAPAGTGVVTVSGGAFVDPVASAATTRATLDVMSFAETIALRRPAGSSALLWECTESTSPLASTGSVACSLANAGAATIGYTEPLSPLAGTALRCAGASNSQVVGGAGVYPSTTTTTAITLWAVVVIRTMPTGSNAGACICRDYAITGGPWADPYACAVMVRASGVIVALGGFGGTPAYDEIASGAGEVQLNRAHLVGLTYDGTTLRAWVDGRQVASKSVASPLTWGADGSWHLGGSGNGSADALDGQVLRAGVETSAWTQAQWATLYRQTVGVSG